MLPDRRICSLGLGVSELTLLSKQAVKSTLGRNHIDRSCDCLVEEYVSLCMGNERSERTPDECREHVRLVRRYQNSNRPVRQMNRNVIWLGSGCLGKVSSLVKPPFPTPGQGSTGLVSGS